jgi:DNA helicase HerA-like ATPase
MASEPMLLAKAGAAEVALLPALANRHGCVTGATGTGKTVTLQRLAEGFSRIGVPVFLADVKGDLAGISRPGSATPKLQERLRALAMPEPEWAGCPTLFWDVWRRKGHPIRATVSDLGPLLLARLLSLNETQAGVLTLVFRVADEEGLLLLDLKDLQALVRFVADNAARLRTSHGNVSGASVGAIQRALLQLQDQGAEAFFGEPMLDIGDLMRVDERGHGYVSVLAADALMQQPRLYATVLLWLLSELYESLPEVGDLEKPKLVFFFDEAHLLFDSAPPALLEKIEQVVRLVRSKGVGIYFVTQTPLDIPETVLGQLGNRVQHALRAFTKRDQRAIKATAETMRLNPGLDLERVIQELAVGEAVISLLDERGSPMPTERALIVPPRSRLGPLSDDERREALARSPLANVYEQAIDRESAFERLRERVDQNDQAPPKTTRSKPTDDTEASRAPVRKQPPSAGELLEDMIFGSTGPRGGRREGLVDVVAKSAARSIGSTLAREITRGVLGSLLGGKRRR